LEAKTVNNFIKDDVINVFMKTVESMSSTVKVASSQFYMELESAGSWDQYIKDHGGYAQWMVEHGILHGYKKFLHHLEDTKITTIILINFDHHWTIIVRQFNGQCWILHYADSLYDHSHRSK